MFRTLANAWKTQDLKKKMLFTLLIVFLYRIGTSIPVPYVSAATLSDWMSQSGTIFAYLNLFSGNGLEQATLFALGVSPYITAQIVIQLLTIAIPALEKLSKDGEEGRKKLDKITRYLSVALSLLTAYGYYTLLKSNGLLTDTGVFAAIVMIACYCAGASLVMWLCERIDEHGIGNGVSAILFVNILSSGYTIAVQLWDQLTSGKVISIICGIISIIVMLLAILLIVFVTNSERRIPVQYAKRVVGRKMYGGQSSNLPLKLNMAGVMPIIFASSITALPQTIFAFSGKRLPDSLGDCSGFWQKFVYIMSPSYHWIGVIIFLVLLFAFAYFYISISFNTVEVSNNLKKNGGFIPGIRPGKPTADYVQKVLNKVTLLGAIFLAVIAGLPMIVRLFAMDYFSATVALSGSSLLIVVGVALETAHELESQLAMRHYKGFLE